MFFITIEVYKLKKVIVLLLFVFAFGCSDDTSSPEDNSIVGEWKRNFESNEIEDYESLILEFEQNGICNSTIATKNGKIENQVNNYTFSDNTLVITSQDCEGAEGVYDVEFRDNGIELELLDDDCERSIFLTGFFINTD